MAELLVRHSLNSSKAVKFNFTLRQAITTKTQGDPVWLLEVGTTEKDLNGNSIPPKIIYNITQSNLDAELENTVSNMCSSIDWGILETDKEAPILIYTYPENDAVNVPVKSEISISIKDLLPATGIDLSDMEVTFDNGNYVFDITAEVIVEGSPFDYTLSWRPHNLGA